MRKTLTDTHRVILANAAARDSLRALPVPSTIGRDPMMVRQSVAELVDDGLLAEVAAEDGDEIWHKNDDAADTTLLITELGLVTIGVMVTGDGKSAAAIIQQRPALGGMPPPASKLQTLVMLMQRPQGALIEELVTITGWQKHSVRGAISGALKKQHRHTISSTLVGGRGRVYRIEMPEAPPAEKSRSAAAVNASGHGSGL
ncbi:DUF3489 domain-containing protein [Devosia sp. A449]